MIYGVLTVQYNERTANIVFWYPLHFRGAIRSTLIIIVTVHQWIQYGDGAPFFLFTKSFPNDLKMQNIEMGFFSHRCRQHSNTSICFSPLKNLNMIISSSGGSAQAFTHIFFVPLSQLCWARSICKNAQSACHFCVMKTFVRHAVDGASLRKHEQKKKRCKKPLYILYYIWSYQRIRK